MGIPNTNNLMATLHIIPVNPVTGMYVTNGEVKKAMQESDQKDININQIGSNDSDFFDLGQTFNFTRLSLEAGKEFNCSLEFIDPTFSQFEAVLAAINRDAWSENFGFIKFMIQIGWVAPKIEQRQILYPLHRDNDFRVGKRLKLANNELLAESFYVTMYKMGYAIQSAGIKYSLQGVYMSHTDEQLFSQSDKVFEHSEKLSYFTILYYLASEMNILLYFDQSVNMDQLTNGPSRFACENKKHTDNLARVLDAINKSDKQGDKDKNTILNLSISGREEDAINALRQCGMQITNAADETARIQSSIRNPSARESIAADDLADKKHGVILSMFTPPNQVMTEYFESKSSSDLLHLPKAERDKAAPYILKIFRHWNKVRHSQVKDYKVYMISQRPSMFSNDPSPDVVYKKDSSIDLKIKGVKFLGVYSHFAKDVQPSPQTSNGQETGVGMITETSVSIDDSIIRMYQKKEFNQIMERTGSLISHYFDLAKLAKGNIITKTAAKLTGTETQGAEATINRLQMLKNPLGVIPPSMNPLPQNLFPVNPLGAFAADAVADPVIAQLKDNMTSENLLRERQAANLGITTPTTDDQLLSASSSKLKELENNDAVKKYHLFDRTMDFVEQKSKDYVQSSLNPEDKTVKITKQVAAYTMLRQLIAESQKIAALKTSYNKAGMMITVRTIGDLALSTDLIGNTLLYIKFFNNNGTLNKFLTGFYLMLGYKHEVSATGSFNTEFNLMAFSIKGTTEQSLAKGGIVEKAQQPLKFNLPYPPPPDLSSSVVASSVSSLRSFGPDGVSYTQTPTISWVKPQVGLPPLYPPPVPPPLPDDERVWSTTASVGGVDIANANVSIQNARLDNSVYVGTALPTPMTPLVTPLLIGGLI